MSGHQLIAVAVTRYHYMLHNAMARDRGSELRELLRIESGAGLMPVRPNQLERNLIRGQSLLGAARRASRLPEENV